MASSSSGAYAVGVGAMPDNEQDPVVESLDQIVVEQEWNRLLLHGPQPPPRSKHAAVSVGRKMFVTGGISPEGTANDVQVFHTERLTWESLGCQSPLPNSKSTRGAQHDTRCPSCSGHSLVFWEKQFVLVGCQKKSASKVVTVLSLDVGSRSWATLSPKGNAPVARTGHTVVQMASMLVLFGGEDIKGRSLNDIYILDLKTLLWLPLETSGTKPSPRRDHCAASYSERYLWIFGGKSRTTYYNDTYCLDFQKMEWSKGRTKGPSPKARACHSGIVVGNRWYIIGGECRGNGLLKMLVFNLESHEWSEVANIRPGSPLANDGISLVRIHSKGRTFMVAFGGHDANLSNKIYVMLLPAKTEVGYFIAETTSDSSGGRSASFNSAYSVLPVRCSLSPLSVRTSDASSGDCMDSTPESTGSLREILRRERESNDNGFDDEDANLLGDKERILASQDPSTSTTANDKDAPYEIHRASHDDRQRLTEGVNTVQIGEELPSQASNLGDFNIIGSHGIKSNSRDLSPNPQNGMQEPATNGDLNERLLAALKLNEDLQTKLLQSYNDNVKLERTLNENTTEKDTLEHQVFDLLNSKADGEWKLEESQRKLEEMERKLNLSSQPQEDPDSRFQSTSREKESMSKPSSPATKLFEDSAFGIEIDASNETERRLEEAESRVAALINSQFLTERQLVTATREKRELSEKAATAMQMMDEFRTACKTLRADNLRLEQDLLAVKALLTETKEELQTKQVELAQATTRNIELQVEMLELPHKFSSS